MCDFLQKRFGACLGGGGGSLLGPLTGNRNELVEAQVSVETIWFRFLMAFGYGLEDSPRGHFEGLWAPEYQDGFPAGLLRATFLKPLEIQQIQCNMSNIFTGYRLYHRHFQTFDVPMRRYWGTAVIGSCSSGMLEAVGLGFWLAGWSEC